MSIFVSCKVFEMKVARFFICLLAAAAAFCSCKEDEEEPTYGYLLGQLKFDREIPEYVEYGYSQTIKMSGAYHPEVTRRADGTYPDTLGYVVSNPLTSKSDTIKRFEDPVDKKFEYLFKVSVDTLNTYTLTASAYAPDYYSTSHSCSFTIVRPGYGDRFSLRGFNTEGEMRELSGKNYYVTEIDGLLWIRQNLADTESGYPFKGCGIMTDIFGQYYTWEQAQTVCPDGWRLPKSAEFDKLTDKFDSIGDLMADIYFNGSKPANKMWTYWPAVGALSNKSGLSLMPTGYAQISDDQVYTFFDLNKRSVLWTSDEIDGNGVARYIYEDQNMLYKGAFNKTNFAASVRCVSEVK